jgi:hypothetical protein
MRDVRHILFLTFTLLLLLVMPAHADPAHTDDDDFIISPQGLRIIDRGTIKKILKSDMVMLNNDKRYRLENVLVPPYEDAPAIDEMKQEFLNKPVTIYAFHEVEEDQVKYGVPYAHIVTTKGIWVQQDLISKGLAWALCTATSPQTVEVLKQAEEKARVDQVGFWKDPAYAVKTPQNIRDYINSYQIVEGTIVGVNVRSNIGLVYFNFGKNWKNNFTVKFLNGPEFKSLSENPTTGELSPSGMKEWKGRTVRVRGWVVDQNGPMIVLTHKEQLDLLSQDDQ